MRNTVRNLIVLSCFFLFFCGECKKAPNEKHSIKLTNSSQSSIGYYFALGGKFGNYYSDTIPPASNDYIGKDLGSNKTFYYYFGGSQENLFTGLPKDTLSVYVFSSDTLSKYPWAEVRNKYKVLKRYDLSLYDLNKLDWTITYPPSTEMKDVKMFPVYP